MMRSPFYLQDTKNFMHYHDNRVFPSEVDQERSEAEGWWRKETTVIHELNINSAIMEPENGLQVPLDGKCGRRLGSWIWFR